MRQCLHHLRQTSRCAATIAVLVLVTTCLVAAQPSCNPAAPDPALCRLLVTAEQVYALDPSNFDSSSQAAITMHYDVAEDPTEGGASIPWLGGVDPFGLTAWDYTRAAGCLGVNGPLGYAGPLGSLGNLPNRFHGHTPVKKGRTWSNNWCNVPVGQNDSACVYGSGGPLGAAGPLSQSAYYLTMYHLGEGVNWSQDYNVNLDASGVWAVQGPLGPTGALGVLGPLGPLSISLQPGVTTRPTGEYTAQDVGLVRTTSPVRYASDGSRWRQYDLFEMYSKRFAAAMTDNDASFAVDSYLSNPSAGGDSFTFTSNFTQFVSVLVTPVNLLDAFGVTISVVGPDGNGTAIAASQSNPYATSQGLINWVVFRAQAGEQLSVTVSMIHSGAPVESGYYLFVAGSGFLEGDSQGTLQPADVWGPRQQNQGSPAFNIAGAHQSWIPL